MADSHHTLDIDGHAVPLRVRRHKRARRLILRVDEGSGGAVVTIPPGSKIQDGVDMAQRQSAWLAGQLKRRAEAVPFADGAVIPVWGVDHVVRHGPGGRGVVCEGGEIAVAGQPEHLSRRLTDWLKKQAKSELSARSHAKFEALRAILGHEGAKIRRLGRISVRDTRSRWGSCGPDGSLNYSWRLIFAPDVVVDYVVAHEIAHLVHRNHGPAFWALAERLSADLDTAKAWLNAQGRHLHRYGAEV